MLPAKATSNNLNSQNLELITHYPKGFTLIELLISISIVAIISGIVISTASAIQKNSRDTQRKADLRMLQAALQQYYADQNYFPLSSGTGSLNLSSTTSLTSSVGNPSPPPSSKTYLNSIPKDPQNNKYCYVAAASVASSDTNCDNSTQKCHGYYLCANLENADPASSPCPAVVSSCQGFNFSLTPL